MCIYVLTTIALMSDHCATRDISKDDRQRKREEKSEAPQARRHAHTPTHTYTHTTHSRDRQFPNRAVFWGLFQKEVFIKVRTNKNIRLQQTVFWRCSPQQCSWNRSWNFFLVFFAPALPFPSPTIPTQTTLTHGKQATLFQVQLTFRTRVLTNKKNL